MLHTQNLHQNGYENTISMQVCMLSLTVVHYMARGQMRQTLPQIAQYTPSNTRKWREITRIHQIYLPLNTSGRVG